MKSDSLVLGAVIAAVGIVAMASKKPKPVPSPVPSPVPAPIPSPVPVPSPVPSPSNTDFFGIKKLYPTISGGVEWDSRSFSVQRTLGNVVDTIDPWLDLSHGDGLYTISGGKLNATGHYCRIYVVNPNHTTNWKEGLEITGYLTRISEFGATADSYIQCFCHTNHGIDYDEDAAATLCLDRGYGCTFLYDGEWSFEKETAHHKANGYATAPNSEKFPLGNTFPKNSPIGFKYIIRNVNSENTQVDLYIDRTNGLDGGTWNLVTSFTDNGTNWGAGYDACASGVNPALRLIMANVLPNSSGRPPFTSVYLRNEEGTVVYERLSVREIGV